MNQWLIAVASALLIVSGASQTVSAQSLDTNKERQFVTDMIGSGKILEALAYAEKEAESATNAKRWEHAAEMYYQAAQMARSLGQLQKALEYATKGNETANASKNPYFQSNAMAVIASALQALGKFDEARIWLAKRLETVLLVPSGGWRSGVEAGAHQGLGREYLRTGELEKAIEHMEYSVQIRESLVSTIRRGPASAHLPVNLNFLANELNGLGDAYRRAGKFEEAIQTYEKSLHTIVVNRVRSSANLPAYLGMGRVYTGKNDISRAEEYFAKTYELASKLQVANMVTLSAIELGRLMLSKKQPAKAIEFFKKAVSHIESSRSQIQSEEFRRSFFDNQGALYAGIIRASLATNSAAQAFDYNERARSRAFLDTLGTKVQVVKSRELAEEEIALKSQINVLRASMTAGESDSSQIARLRESLQNAEKAYAGFLAKVRKENKEQASLMNVEPLTLKQLQELLDPGVTVLEYFITNNSVIVWVIDKGTALSISVPLRRKEIQAKVTTFRESISQLEERGKLNQQARDLFNHLIQPALQHVRGKELLIIPHDLLHYLPFQALLSPSGKYLIEDYPINYLSSASLMQFTQEKRKARGELSSVLAKGGSVLTFGNPDLGDPKMSLAFAGIEAKEIKILYPQSTIYLEKEATEETAKALVGNSDIIHFASHAELNEDDPLASAIRLAKSDKEDGRLEVREIFGMDLKASLVVLSACETGLGKLSSGDELVGLTRAFIYAGTPSVVASLWNVEDSSTAQLMASFYKNLKTMTKVEALRQAQLQLIRGNVNSELLARRGIGGVGKLGEAPKPQPLTQDSISVTSSISVSTSHPYFWAPFILVGEGK